MKMKLVALAVIGFGMSSAIAQKNVPLNTDIDKLSYSIGIDLGKNFKRQDIEISPNVIQKGIQDGLTGAKPQLTEQQMQEVLQKFQKELIARRTQQINKKAEENKVKGEAFLKENKTKPGVVTLPSGLQYKIITAGTGEKPNKEDTVTVEYTGRLINGEVFDSTKKSGKPATFKLSQVIPGWIEVLQLMPAGSTWEVYIPSDLAYGPRSMGGAIGPNELLIFNIHLLSVKKD